MKIEYDGHKPVGVTTLMSVGNTDLADVLDDTKSRVQNALLAGGAGYLLGRLLGLRGDTPQWMGLVGLGIWLIK